MERELVSSNTAFRARKATFGDDVLQFVRFGYVERSFAGNNVAGYPSDRYPQILAQFRTVTSATLPDAG